MRAADTPPPTVTDLADLQKRRRHELRDLAVRGVDHPESLTPDEVRKVSSVALIGINDARAASDEAPKPRTP